jgi:hypothetical protein
VRDPLSVRTATTHPARWVAAAIVLAVLSWDIWQTAHEVMAARGQPGRTPGSSAAANDPAAAPAHAVTASQ